MLKPHPMHPNPILTALEPIHHVFPCFRVFRVDDIKEQKLVLDRKWRGDLSYKREPIPHVFYRVTVTSCSYPNPTCCP